MPTESTPSFPAPSIDFLRATAAQQGVFPADDDLTGVLALLDVVLPRLAELEARLPPETPL